MLMGWRREQPARATQLPSPRAKAFPRNRSFFSTSKRAAVYPRRIIFICVPGARSSSVWVFVRVPIVPEYQLKKDRVRLSLLRTTSANVLLAWTLSFSFSTMSARLRRAAPSRKIRLPRQLAELPLPRFGNSRSLRAGWNAPFTVRRAITRTAIATPRVTPPILGFST